MGEVGPGEVGGVVGVGDEVRRGTVAPVGGAVVELVPVVGLRVDDVGGGWWAVGGGWWVVGGGWWAVGGIDCCGCCRGWRGFQGVGWRVGVAFWRVGAVR